MGRVDLNSHKRMFENGWPNAERIYRQRDASPVPKRLREESGGECPCEQSESLTLLKRTRPIYQTGTAGANTLNDMLETLFNASVDDGLELQCFHEAVRGYMAGER
jgi:hypothetical protein